MSMKYINMKKETGEYVLSDDEIFNFVEQMCERYPLRTTSYKGYFVHELIRNLAVADCTISRYMSEDAPIRQIEDYCIINDYEFCSPHLYEEDVEIVKREFRLFMMSKFEKYAADLKKIYKTNKR